MTESNEHEFEVWSAKDPAASDIIARTTSTATEPSTEVVPAGPTAEETEATYAPESPFTEQQTHWIMTHHMFMCARMASFTRNEALYLTACAMLQHPGMPPDMH
jgi:hypothetical protein